MIVRTKKYQLPKKTYVKLALLNLLKKQWYFIFIPVAIGCLTFIWPNTVWFIVIAILVPLLYILFWLIQFTGVTQLEQNKVMFEKLSYEIDSRQVLIKLNAKQGSPLQWNMFKEARKDKDHFLLIVSKAQLIHLPFRIFNSENDIKFVESILRRKEYIK